MLASIPVAIIVNVVKDFFKKKFCRTGKLIDHVQLHCHIMSMDAEQLPLAIIYDLSR